MREINIMKLIILFCFLCLQHNISQAQRYINLEADSVFSPDTIREFEKPIVRYSLKNAGPDSIYRTDSFLIAFVFNPFYGPEVEIPNVVKWGKEYFTFPFNKDLGKGDTVIFNWKCPSTFKAPYTKIGYVAIVTLFNVVDTNLVKVNPIPKNNFALKNDVVFYFPTSSLSALERQNSILVSNPIYNGILQFKAPIDQFTSVRIYNALGQLKIQISGAMLSQTLDLNPFNLNDGIYYLEIEQDARLLRQKVIIMH